MIDIHSHILPSLDDGSNSIEQTIEMAKQAEAQGIRTMIATPHHKNGSYINIKADIERQTASINEILLERQINVHIAPGQEVRLYGELVEDYKKGELLPINNTNYLLVELPSDHVPAYTKRVFYDLQLAGVQPIIAHPERNREIAVEPNKLYELVKHGALAQLTAASVTGAFGKNIKRLSEQFINNQLVHFIASDTHNTTTRSNLLQAAYDILEKDFDTETVYYMKENAEIVFNGETVLVGQPSRIKKKKFLGIL